MKAALTSTCKSCSEDVVSPPATSTTWTSAVVGFMILILPKCPFCVVAYTSSMAICGAPSLTEHHTDWGAWLSLGLAAVCLWSIARNYRGPGTRAALVVATSGLCLLLVGLFMPHAMRCYYAGAALLFLGSLYNGRGYRWLNRVGTALLSVKNQSPIS